MRNLAGENGPRIAWHNQAGGISVPDEEATAIFRIAQESISNAIRHARATIIDVSLVRKNGTLVLAIEDDGSGMLPAYTPEDHYGLVGMRERAIMIGADLHVISNRDEGTKIVMEYQPC
jgi:signal transduction histidine kinase